MQMRGQPMAHVLPARLPCRQPWSDLPVPRVLLRVLISAVVIACFARALWFVVADPPAGLMPLQIEHEASHYVVHAVPGVALPSPLAEGQIVLLTQMGTLDRAALFHPQPIPVGTRADVVVRQGDRTLRATVVAAQAPPTQLSELERVLGGVLLVFGLAVALLTLWRGRDGTAWGLCFFASGLLVDNGGLGMTAAPLASLWLVLARVLLEPFNVGALYVMAECLAGVGLPQVWRTVARLGVAMGVLAAAGSGIAARVLLVHQGLPVLPWLMLVRGVAVAVLLALPGLTLLIGYGGASPESRRRMRWVLVSTGVLGVSLLIVFFANLSPDGQPVLFALFNTVLPGLGVLGYLYAILRTRVVDVTFVIDRAVVFSVTTTLLFGMFSLLEQSVHRLALGEQLGWLVQALGAVAVAALLSSLHRLLDRGLQRVFFHRLRTMAGALRALAAECAFFENSEALLARALKQLLAPCAAASVYERVGAVYQRRSAYGEGWPEALDADDPVFVTLRARRQALDIKGLESTAGGEGLAFPMTVGQLLTGAVMVRLRAGEQLDRDVRAATGELAQSLGTSLYLLRNREQTRLLGEIAAGSLDQEAVRTRAAEILGTA
jgi:hypothetical protein